MDRERERERKKERKNQGFNNKMRALLLSLFLKKTLKVVKSENLCNSLNWRRKNYFVCLHLPGSVFARVLGSVCARTRMRMCVRVSESESIPKTFRISKIQFIPQYLLPCYSLINLQKQFFIITFVIKLT